MLQTIPAPSAKPRGSAEPLTTSTPASSDIQLLCWVVVCSLGLFISRPFNIDDPLFVWTAQQIQQNPTDFYGYEVNWYDYRAPASTIIKNPPLTSYYLAAVGALFGLGETTLHLAMLVPNVLLVVGSYLIARLFCKAPRFAALVALATPAVLVSATSVMCDTMMLTFWCWGIVTWLAAMRRQHFTLALLAGLLIGLSALTKYFGIALVPLLAAYTLLLPKGQRASYWPLAMLVPLAMIAAYSAYTSHLYGRGLFLDAAFYAHAQQPSLRESLLQLLELFAFLGGSFFTLACFLPAICSRREWTALALIAAAFFVGLLFTGNIGEYRFPIEAERALLTRVQLALFMTLGIFLVWLAWSDFWRHRDRTSLLLLLWVAGTCLFAAKLNWTVNARSLLPLAPALGILVARRWPHSHDLELNSQRAQYAMVTLALLLSMGVAWGDTAIAKANQMAARELTERYAREGETLWFQGHWGFQYYMQQGGARHIDILDMRLEQGSLVVVPRNNSVSFHWPDDVCPAIDALAIPVAPFVTTVDNRLGVNFYASSGPHVLPLFFTPTNREEFVVRQCEAPVNFQAEEGTVELLNPGGGF